MKFVKMNGCGNDYVYFDLTSTENATQEEKIVAAVPRISDRHFGVGGDGVVLIMRSEEADVRMRMFNLDGSEGKMCGNAIRCVGKYAYDTGLVQSRDITVQTASGIKKLSLAVTDGVCTGATVDMGRAVFRAAEIPLDESRLPEDFVPVYCGVCGKVWKDVPVSSGGKEWKGMAVSMGNPHFVIFTEENIDALDLEKYGRPLETHPLFPDKVNVEFVNVTGDGVLKMRVWERGSGETMACGTGSCATVAAAVAGGICKAGEQTDVVLRGGTLKITYCADGVKMTGGAEINFTGDVTL